MPTNTYNFSSSNKEQRLIDEWGLWISPNNQIQSLDYIRNSIEYLYKIRTLEHDYNEYDYWHDAFKHGQEIY